MAEVTVPVTMTIAPPALGGDERIPQSIKYASLIIAITAAIWCIIDAIFLLISILGFISGIIRIVLGALVLIIEPTFLVHLCLQDNETFKKIHEKLSVISYIHKAVLYSVVPIITMAMAFKVATLINTILFCVAAGLNGYSYYLIRKDAVFWLGQSFGPQIP